MNTMIKKTISVLSIAALASPFVQAECSSKAASNSQGPSSTCCQDKERSKEKTQPESSCAKPACDTDEKC